jgi:hypothetical protein
MIRRFGDRPEDELGAEVVSALRTSSICFRFFEGCGVPRRCVDGGIDGVDMVPHRDHGGGGRILSFMDPLASNVLVREVGMVPVEVEGEWDASAINGWRAENAGPVRDVEPLFVVLSG